MSTPNLHESSYKVKSNANMFSRNDHMMTETEKVTRVSSNAEKSLRVTAGGSSSGSLRADEQSGGMYER